MLIRPWNYHDEGVAEHDLSREWRNGPYNLLCLATQLKNAGIPFRLVDLEPILVKVRGDDCKCLEYLNYEISSFHPDIIGVSFFSYQFLEVDRIVKYIKAVCHKNRLEPVLIAGGIHASVEPRQTLNELGFDYVFVGEADTGIVDLGRSKVPENIPGIVTKHTTTIQKGQAVEDLNSLPFVDWSLCDYKFYSHLNSSKISSRPVRTLDLSMSRGCLNRCGFCAYSALSKLRFYSPEYLVDNIAHMLSSYGIDSIYFIDSSVGNNRDVLEGFCKKFMQRNLQYSCEWYANMRADQIDESLLKLLWAAGCRSLFYGFESASQRILDLMNKNCTVEQNVKAAEIHNRLGFLYHASMVLGYSGETEQDIKLTFDFLEKTMPPSIGINWYVPLPGSRDYKKLKKNDQLQVQDPHEWRRIGEVLATGRVYADIEENHFRQLFRDAQTLVSRITAKDLNTWAGSHPSVTKPKAHSIEQTPPRVERNTIMSEKDLACSSDFELKLREKWRELPATRRGRNFSSEMLEWSDEELLAHWEECKQQTCTPEVRGWYQELHKNEFAGLEIADVGPGVGLDGIFFAEHGAHVTFVDIVGDNLKLLKRICRLKGVEADYYFIDDFFNFHFSKEFDAFVCIGSLINAPFEFMKRQIEAMSKFLKVNGKVLMLAYPKERYLQSGAQDFAEFGKMTDGERTPWAEWYDDEKVEALFGPNFKLNWSRNFGEDNIEFNWFELTKVRCDVYGERKKEHGSTKLRSATPQFTCHGLTPQPTFVQQESVGTACATEPKILVEPQQENSITIPSVPAQRLHEELGFARAIDYPQSSLNKPLEQWKMEVDDSPIFRYIYRNFRPRRHLEFGTWQGTGTLYCLEECDATVWSINLLEGEVSQDGSIAYGIDNHERASAQEWARKMGLEVKHWPKTDSIGYIGRFYLEKDLGSRVCQIYGDSTKWDISNYPPMFFDTALIDGGHKEDVVISDTAKAFALLRSDGLIMWHDFCPPIYDKFETTLGVMRAIHQQWEWINEQTLKLFWIYPSWILVGVKK